MESKAKNESVADASGVISANVAPVIEDLITRLSAPLYRCGYKPEGLVDISGINHREFVPYAPNKEVLNRLNDVCGEYWSVDYQMHNMGFICTISIRSGGQTISRSAFGQASTHDAAEAKKAGLRDKSGQSNALVRAARAFGIGSYEETLPPVMLALTAKNTYKLPSGQVVYGGDVAGKYLSEQMPDLLYFTALTKVLRPELKEAAKTALLQLFNIFKEKEAK